MGLKYRKLFGAIVVLILIACGVYSTGINSSEPVPILVSTSESILMTSNDIVHMEDISTELQFEQYRIDILGKQIQFKCQVLEVYENGEVLLGGGNCGGLFTYVSLLGIPFDIVIGLNEDQLISGEGVVVDVHLFLGTHIDIEVTSLSQ